MSTVWEKFQKAQERVLLLNKILHVMETIPKKLQKQPKIG